jgi:outer membrane immunogenic protein
MHRSRLATAAVVLSMSTFGAFAADYASPVPPSSPIFTWTGFYLGVNGGSASMRQGNPLTISNSFFDPMMFPSSNLPTFSRASRHNRTEFIGGGQIGYNWQIGNLVLGMEADFSHIGGVDYPSTATPFSVPLGPTTTFVTSGEKGKHFVGTLRSRVGYSFDRLLIYATGGLSYGDFASGISRVGSTDALGNATSNFTADSSDSASVGYAIGAGAEYALTTSWTVKAEYLYVDLGRRYRWLLDPNVPPGFSFAARAENRADIARVGLNYKF